MKTYMTLACLIQVEMSRAGRQMHSNIILKAYEPKLSGRNMSDFREMRRKRQQLSEEESVCILKKGTAGTLALLGDNGYPYAVPISYVFADGKLYFHSALSGHKICHQEL